MKKTKFGSESGISILELLIVLVIGAILISVAVAQFGNSKMQLQRQNIAREFKNNLERCRFDSVRRRAVDAEGYERMARIIIRSATKYEVLIDSNSDGRIENSEVRVVDFTGRSDAKLLVDTDLLPVTVRFNQRGHITTDSNGGSVFPLFTICSGVCTMATTITPENANVISISPTGTVAMLYGGDIIPPLAAPAVSNVGSPGANVSWTMTMDSTGSGTSSSNTSGGTNSNSSGGTNPTPTPTPTPSVLPDSTPTPTATPAPTATPTPSLKACAFRQRVGNPPTCLCQISPLPPNGKCE